MSQRRKLNRYDLSNPEYAVMYVRHRSGEEMKVKIDHADVDRLRTRYWKACSSNHGGVVYVHSSYGGPGTTHLLHRFLMNAPSSLQVDHKNHDTLDNRRSTNLCLRTQTLNQLNRLGAQANHALKRRNVYLIRGKYWAIVTVAGKRHRLGSFDDPDVAGKVAGAFILGVSVASEHLVDREVANQ